MTLRMVADDRLKPESRDRVREPDRLTVADVALDQRLEQQLRALAQRLVGTFCHIRSI